MLFRHEPFEGALAASGTTVMIIPDFKPRASSTGKPSIRTFGLLIAVPVWRRRSASVAPLESSMVCYPTSGRSNVTCMLSFAVKAVPIGYQGSY